jgi:sterol desaturase/sphingolipid hydroxylase (fatty acid hydroxylase superfamily)
MAEPGFILQVVTFIVLVAFFNYREQRTPGFKVNKGRDLALNIAAMAIVIFCGEYVKAIVLVGYDLINASRVVSFPLLRSLPGAAKIAVGIVLTDFSLYWMHRAIHHPLLWRTHMFHHSIPEIWWLAGSRTSILHLLLFAVPQVFISTCLLHLSQLETGIALSFGIFINLWIHTNLWVNLGPLESFLVTPNYHRIHHGGQGLASRNMGFVLTAWDHLFGTWLDPAGMGKQFPIVPVPVEKQLLRMMIGL